MIKGFLNGIGANTKVGDKDNMDCFYCYDYNRTYSKNHGDYKFMIGNSSTNINESTMTAILQPIIEDYNKTKGSQSDNIKIQCQVAGDYTSPGVQLT